MDVKLKRPGLTEQVNFLLDPGTKSALKAMANIKGLKYQQLIRMYVMEGLRKDETALARELHQQQEEPCSNF